MSGGPGQFLTAWTSRPGAFYCRCGIGGVSYYHGKKDHNKRVTTERPHPTERFRLSGGIFLGIGGDLITS